MRSMFDQLVLMLTAFLAACGAFPVGGHIGPVPRKDSQRVQEALQLENEFTAECIRAGRNNIFCAPNRSEYAGFYFVDDLGGTTMGLCSMYRRAPWLLRANEIRYSRKYWDQATTLEKKALVWHENLHCRAGVQHVPNDVFSLMHEVLPTVTEDNWPSYAREALERIPE